MHDPGAMRLLQAVKYGNGDLQEFRNSQRALD
jgi:hypothetical protein